MEKSKVSIVRCKTYAPEECDAAVEKALSLLGGIEAFVKPGMRVFVKPNLLLAASPARAITTHPAVMRPILRACVKAGAEVFFGDLPGGFHAGNVKLINDKCGMTPLAEETGAKLVHLEQYGFKRVRVAEGVKLRELFVPKFLDDMDLIINVPKLKTHMQSRYTGAVKNLFGFIPTADRLAAHREKDCAEFSVTLVDIFSVFKPGLNIMDAVVGMEGTGPSQGSPVNIGFIAASTDAVALDSVACHAVSFDPAAIPAIDQGARRGFGKIRLSDIDVSGETINSVKKKIRPPSSAVAMFLPKFEDFINKSTEVRPYIATDRCVKCRMCAEVCPVSAIHTGDTFKIKDSVCIRCFCCHEVCPHSAVRLKKPVMVRLFEAAMSRRR